MKLEYGIDNSFISKASLSAIVVIFQDEPRCFFQTPKYTVKSVSNTTNGMKACLYTHTYIMVHLCMGRGWEEVVEQVPLDQFHSLDSETYKEPP